jgi:hypothetical protein
MITQFKLYESKNEWLKIKGDFIGKGGFGEVFNVKDNDMVVMKITTDKSEYETARRLIGQKNEYLVRYYDAEEIGGKYYLLMDKVITFLPQSYNNILDELNEFCYDHDEDFYYDTLFNAEEIDFIIDDLSEEYKKKDIKYIITQLRFIVNECKKYDIQTNDFHSKNIGKRNEHLVFFDIGVTK